MSEGPKVELVREDMAETWRRGMKGVREQIEAERPTRLAEREAARQAAQYGVRESLYFRVVKLGTREGQPDKYRATCISGLPEATMGVTADGPTPEDAVHEARFGYAEALYKARACKTWDESRARAAKADLCIADVVT